MAHGLVFYHGTPLEAVVRSWLDDLAVDSGSLNVARVVESTGPTDGNVRISFHAEHQLAAPNERKAEVQFRQLLGEATCQRMDITEEDGGSFLIEADVQLDFDLPLDPSLGQQSSVEALRAIYEMAEAEYAKRFGFDEMNALEVEVLNVEGEVLDIVTLIGEKGGAM